jgi:hypothetical protein
MNGVDWIISSTALGSCRIRLFLATVTVSHPFSLYNFLAYLCRHSPEMPQRLVNQCPHIAVILCRKPRRSRAAGSDLPFTVID